MGFFKWLGRVYTDAAMLTDTGDSLRSRIREGKVLEDKANEAFKIAEILQDRIKREKDEEMIEKIKIGIKDKKKEGFWYFDRYDKIINENKYINLNKEYKSKILLYWDERELRIMKNKIDKDTILIKEERYVKE